MNAKADGAGLHLSLWKQALGAVPEETWARTDLRTLVLADNDLTEISDRVGNLRALQMLDLGHNRLRDQSSRSGGPGRGTTVGDAPSDAAIIGLLRVRIAPDDRLTSEGR